MIKSFKQIKEELEEIEFKPLPINCIDGHDFEDWLRESDLIGYCRECGSKVYNTDELLPEYKGVFECSKCSHPHSKDELWDEMPDYLKNE